MKSRASFYAAYAFVFVFVIGISLLIPTQSAHASWLTDAANNVVSSLGDAVTNIISSTADEWFSPLLRTAVNLLIGVSNTVITSITDGDTLTSTFTTLIDGAYPTIRTIHHNVVVPFAYAVLAVFFVMGLVRQLQTMGQHESGIDMWQLMLVFLMLAMGIVIIQNSLELMTGIYALITEAISELMDVGAASASLSTVGTVDEDFDSAGLLLVMLIVALLGVALSLICWLVIHVVILARSVQIYVYTCFAPLPLACLASESARPMATGFLKRYVATVGSGGVIALLLILYSAVANNWTLTTSVVPTGVTDTIEWIIGYVGNLVPMIMLAWTMSKSGAWAREMVGV